MRILCRKRVTINRYAWLLIFVPWFCWLSLISYTFITEAHYKWLFNVVLEPPLLGFLGLLILGPSLLYKNSDSRIRIVSTLIITLIVSFFTIIISKVIPPLQGPPL